MMTVVLPVLAIVVVVAVIVAASWSGTGKKAQLMSGGSVPASVLSAVTSIPAATFAAVGKGTAMSSTAPAFGTALSSAGKPEVLYVGAEYCPYCASERWALVVALSRFGTFSDLGLTHSSAGDVYPNTATFTFHGATYASDYLSFVGKEIYSNTAAGNGYQALDPLTGQESREFKALSPQESFPFVDLAGRYVVTAVQFSPTVLAGKAADQIAGALAGASDPTSKAVVGTANTITASLCTLTGGKPARVCAAPEIQKLSS